MAATSETLRVLAIHRYFWPDTPPYASLLRVIATHWASRGHAVDVLTSQPSYKPELGIGATASAENIDGMRVRRISMDSDRIGRWRRVANMVRFPLLVFVRVLFGPKYNLVMCSTAPPVVLGALVSWAAQLRSIPFVYHCMDLHPEIGALSGEFKNPVVYKLLLWVDTQTCKRAAAVVVLSGDMRDALVARSPDLAQSIVIINNFEVPVFDSEEAEPEPALEECTGLRILFAGNLGRYQGLEVITSAMLADEPRLDGVQLVLMGEGSAKADLIELVEAAPPDIRTRVKFVPHGSVADARRQMAAAHMGLVCLSPSVISYAYPSKTATYLAERLPLLVAVEPESSLARQVRTWGVGELISVDSPESVRDTLIQLVGRQHEIAGMRIQTSKTWQENFASGTVLPRWDALLEDVTRERGRQ